ncbi:MAG: TIGR04388 family protein [Spirochaetota bacterium]
MFHNLKNHTVYLTTFFILFLIGFLPIASIFSQPPDLSPHKKTLQDFNFTFVPSSLSGEADFAAKASADLQNFEANWETAINAEIDTIVANDTSTDPNAVRQALELQKETMRSEMVQEVESFIAAELNNYKKTLQGDNLPVPELVPLAFQSQDLDSVFSQADTMKNQNEWETVVATGLTTLENTWQANIDAQIASHLASFDHSDAFTSKAEYESYLRNVLQAQKKTAAKDWQKQADAAIQSRRQTFVTSLADKNLKDTTENTTEDTKTSQNETNATEQEAIQQITTGDPSQVWQNAEDYLQNAELDWWNDFQGQVKDGQYQYQIAIANLDTEYTDLVDALDKTENQFLANIDEINTYEARVLQGIRHTTDSLESALQSNGMFYVETCDAQHNCSLDMNTLNQAGTELSDLIGDIRKGLDENAPISELTKTITEYLETQKLRAEQERDKWQIEIRKTVASSDYINRPIVYGTPQYTTPPPPQEDGDPNTPEEQNNETSQKDPFLTPEQQAEAARWQSIPGGETPDSRILYVHEYSATSAVVNYLDTNNETRLRDYLVNNRGEWRVIEAINRGGTDVRGTHRNYFSGDWRGEDNFGEWYSQAGDAAFNFNADIHTYWRCSWGKCKKHYGWRWFREPDAEVKISYNIYNPNAEVNHANWSGYADDISNMFTKWKEDLLPAVNQWESAAAKYRNEYSEWKQEADQIREDAKTAYDSNRSNLIESRDQWRASMKKEYQRGKKKWLALNKKLAKKKKKFQGKNLKPKKARRVLSRLFRKIPEQNTVDVEAKIAEATTELPTVTDEFFSSADQGVPNSATAVAVVDEFQKTSNALLNLTVARSLEESAGRALDRKVEGIRNYLEGNGYDVSIEGENLIATRSVVSGAVSRARGDGTDSQDYDDLMMTQSFNIIVPGAAKMVKTGSLMDTWDMNSIMSEFQENMREANSNNQIASAADLAIQKNQETLTKNYKKRSKNIKKAIQEANDYKRRHQNRAAGLLKSIAIAMFTGGTDFTTAAQAEVQNRIVSAAAETLGVPAGILQGIASGLPVHEAFNDWVDTELKDEMIVEAAKATGFPATVVSAFASGGDMKDAWQDATEDMVMQEIGKRVDDPALQQLLQSAVKGHRKRLDDKRKGTFRDVPVLGTVQKAYRMQREGKSPRDIQKTMVNDVLQLSSTFTPILGVEMDLEYTDKGLNGDVSIGVPLGGPKLATASIRRGGIRSVKREDVSEKDLRKGIGSKNIFDSLKDRTTKLMSLAMQYPSALVQHWQGAPDRRKEFETNFAAYVENKAYEQAEEMFNVPSTILRGVAQGRDMRRVWKQYTDEAVDETVAKHIESASNCSNRPSDEQQACQMMAQQMHANYAKWKKERALTEARKWRSEDAATGGLTYAWRVSEHDEDLAFAMSAGETAAGYVAAGTGWGTAIYAGYMGLKEGYANQRAANNEDKSAAMAAGLANGALTGVMKHYELDKYLDVNITFDPEDGFGTTVGVSGPLGDKDNPILSKLKAGIELSFSEKDQGFSGGGVTFGTNFEEGFNANLGVDFNKNGGFDGASLEYTWKEKNKQKGTVSDLGVTVNIDSEGYYSGSSINASHGQSSGHGVNGNVSFDADGQFANGGIGYTYKTENKGTGDKTGLDISHTAGVGLTFGADGGYGMYVSNSIDYENIRNRINKIDASTKNTMMYDANGEFTGANSQTSTSFEFQTNRTRTREIKKQRAELYDSLSDEQKKILEDVERLAKTKNKTAKEIHADIQALLDERLATLQTLGMIDADTARNMRNLAEFNEMYETETGEGALERRLKDLVQRDKITPEKMKEYMKDPSKLHDLDLEIKLDGYKYAEKSRRTFRDKIAGAFGDAWKWIKGDVSSRNGYIDSKTGEFVIKTCFTAGTPIRVHPSTPGAYSKEGKFYKNIEEIKYGDKVLSWDEKSGEESFQAVVQTFKKKTNLIYQLSYEDGTDIETTWNHPFYTEERGWVMAKDLQVGNRSKLASFAKEETSRATITMQENDLETPSTLLPVSLNTTLPTSGLRIQSIGREFRDETVYNLEVANNHTYFVTHRSVLVHNYKVAQEELDRKKKDKEKEIQRQKIMESILESKHTEQPDSESFRFWQRVGNFLMLRGPITDHQYLQKVKANESELEYWQEKERLGYALDNDEREVLVKKKDDLDYKIKWYDAAGGLITMEEARKLTDSQKWMQHKYSPLAGKMGKVIDKLKKQKEPIAAWSSKEEFAKYYKELQARAVHLEKAILAAKNSGDHIRAKSLRITMNELLRTTVYPYHAKVGRLSERVYQERKGFIRASTKFINKKSVQDAKEKSVAASCNIVATYLYGKLTNREKRTFEEYYKDGIEKGIISPTSWHGIYGIHTGTANRDTWTNYGITKYAKPQQKEDGTWTVNTWTGTLKKLEKERVAIAYDSSHYFTVVKNKKGQWINMDHTKPGKRGKIVNFRSPLIKGVLIDAHLNDNNAQKKEEAVLK